MREESLLFLLFPRWLSEIYVHTLVSMKIIIEIKMCIDESYNIHELVKNVHTNIKINPF